MIVGVTGCPGAGKSRFANVMAEHGWRLIDADGLGREVVETSEELLARLADAFGHDILLTDGTLDRRLLGTRAFAGREETRRLNEIVHPALIETIESRIGECVGECIDAVVDCALIFEWNIARLFNIIICITATRENRAGRLMDRDGRSAEDVARMNAAQRTQHEKVRASDIVIANDASVARLDMLARVFSEVTMWERSDI